MVNSTIYQVREETFEELLLFFFLHCSKQLPGCEFHTDNMATSGTSLYLSQMSNNNVSFYISSYIHVIHKLNQFGLVAHLDHPTSFLNFMHVCTLSVQKVEGSSISLDE